MIKALRAKGLDSNWFLELVSSGTSQFFKLLRHFDAVAIVITRRKKQETQLQVSGMVSMYPSQKSFGQRRCYTCKTESAYLAPKTRLGHRKPVAVHTAF